MEKTIDFVQIKGEKFINEVDYLKVVEEKESLNNLLKHESHDNSVYINEKYHEKIVKEKDVEIVRLNKRLDSSLKANDVNYDRVKEIEGELKEKDEVIEELRVVNKSLYLQCEEYEKEIKELNKRITCLELGIVKEKEEMWVLEYCFENSITREVKEIKLDPQPLEEIHELVGMDCDNWISWKCYKY